MAQNCCTVACGENLAFVANESGGQTCIGSTEVEPCLDTSYVACSTVPAVASVLVMPYAFMKDENDMMICVALFWLISWMVSLCLGL